MSIEVGEATEADVPAIAAFFRKAWSLAGPGAPGWAGADESVIDELTRPHVLAERVVGTGRRMFLSRDGARVVGFAAVRADEADRIELAGIVVLQSMTGRGIGGPLLDAAVEWARESGFRTMVVKTEADNDRALRFYRDRGFVEHARMVEDVEGEPVALIELWRELQSVDVASRRDDSADSEASQP